MCSTVKKPKEIFNYADVEACGIFRIITTLEFLQHHFSEMGHRDLLVTQTYLNQQATTAPFPSRVASAAGRLRSSPVPGSCSHAAFSRSRMTDGLTLCNPQVLIGNSATPVTPSSLQEFIGFLHMCLVGRIVS